LEVCMAELLLQRGSANMISFNPVRHREAAFGLVRTFSGLLKW
jgi:hypothetical protein